MIVLMIILPSLRPQVILSWTSRRRGTTHATAKPGWAASRRATPSGSRGSFAPSLTLRPPSAPRGETEATRLPPVSIHLVLAAHKPFTHPGVIFFLILGMNPYSLLTLDKTF